jgi:2-methylfumaryl-CoA hydratase
MKEDLRPVLSGPRSPDRCRVGGPFFEDLARGQVLEDAPAVTLTDGWTAMYQAMFGDRLSLALDAPLTASVTGLDRVVHPSLVCHIAIGQSTWFSQRVVGNLFYRGLVMLRPVHVGDTLSTRTEVVALKENRRRPGRDATGLVVLHVRTVNQRGEPVLDFWRCPMIPLRDGSSDTGHADDVDLATGDVDRKTMHAAVPPTWRLDVFRERLAHREHFKDIRQGAAYEIEGRETVTSAPELVRLTLNRAATHLDAAASAYGRRLVYGGHVVSIAGAQMSRALPNIATFIAWRRCDHNGPVFEGDVLRTDVEIDDIEPLGAGHGLVGMTVTTYADRGDGSAEELVLTWRPVVLMA